MEAAGVDRSPVSGISEAERTNKEIRQTDTQWDDTLNVISELENILIRPNTGYFEQYSLNSIKEYIYCKTMRYALLKWASLLRTFMRSAPSEQLLHTSPSWLRKGYRLSNAEHSVCLPELLLFQKLFFQEYKKYRPKVSKRIRPFISLSHRSGKELVSSILLSLAVRLGSSGGY